MNGKQIPWTAKDASKIFYGPYGQECMMTSLFFHGSLQQTLSQALNTMGLYNDYTFRSMLQAQEIRLRSPDRLSPRGVWSGHQTMLAVCLVSGGVHVASLREGGGGREVGAGGGWVVLGGEKDLNRCNGNTNVDSFTHLDRRHQLICFSETHSLTDLH